MRVLNKVLIGTENTWSAATYSMRFPTVSGRISILFDNKQMSDRLGDNVDETTNITNANASIRVTRCYWMVWQVWKWCDSQSWNYRRTCSGIFMRYSHGCICNICICIELERHLLLPKFVSILPPNMIDPGTQIHIITCYLLKPSLGSWSPTRAHSTSEYLWKILKWRARMCSPPPSRKNTKRLGYCLENWFPTDTQRPFWCFALVRGEKMF